MTDNVLDPIEEVEIRHGATLDFLARFAGLLCEKGVIQSSEVIDLLEGLKPQPDPNRSEIAKRRTLCYVSALDRLTGHLGR